MSVNEPRDAVNTGMANRQRDVDLSFTQVSALSKNFSLAWLGKFASWAAKKLG
jgi:hypothetical protein